VKLYKLKRAHKGIKGISVVRAKMGWGVKIMGEEGCEKIPSVNDNPTRQTSQNM
jgi:hypothetical protein